MDLHTISDSVTFYQRILVTVSLYRIAFHFCSGEVNDLLEDNLAEVASAIVKEFDDGKLTEAVKGGHDGWQAWIKGIGKGMKRKVGRHVSDCVDFEGYS